MMAQLFTLAGVTLGAISSYLVGSLSERTRYRRNLSRQWVEREIESYARYLSDLKDMSTLARRVTASVGLDDHALPLPRDQGLPLLAEAEIRRGQSSEVLTLVAGPETLEAHRALNLAVWRLEWFARGPSGDLDRGGWQKARREYENAVDTFHASARHELGVPGEYVSRTSEPSSFGPAVPSL